ncbi:MAG: methyltransferase domain-containing protein [Candidatus Nanohaloarchaeota archaeon QJJ-5]|nr:methyltransferase domain-containing protein [Candidatus Nanohaloarchaeota archaeon QJJ-5]
MNDMPWDDIAADWDRKMGGEGDFFQRHLTIPAIESLIGSIEDKRVLDAGCGNGFLARHFATQGATVTGVDTSEALIEQARDYDDTVEYQVADIKDMSLGETYDVILCNNVIQHIEDYQRVLDTFDDHLADDGRIIITVRHPCFKPIQEDAGWRLEGTEKIEHTGTGLSELDLPESEPRSFKITKYFEPETAEREFEGERIPIINRTLSDHAEALREQGFCITGLREPVPGEDGRQERPDLCRLLETIPHFLIFEISRH